MKYFLFFSFILLLTFSCKNREHNHEKNGNSTEQKIDKSGPEYTSKYTCPMHCKGSGSDTTGVCPTCKMDYVLTKVEHDHHDNEGHDHKDHGHKEGDKH